MRTLGCKALLTWGVNDAHLWIPGFYRGLGAALLFDRESQPKPARDAIETALKNDLMQFLPARAQLARAIKKAARKRRFPPDRIRH
jgi:hypothetical protein